MASSSSALRCAWLTAFLALGCFSSQRVFAGTAVPLNNPGLDGPFSPVSQNGGKISGAIANGWSDNSGWANPTIQYSQETSNCHSGASCQKIEVSSVGSGRMQFVQTYQQQAGNIYTVSAWVRGTPGVQASLSIQQAAAPYATILSGSITLASGWQQVTAMGYITTTESVYLMLGMNAPGTVWADDFAASYTPGTIVPTPVLGPIPPSFFGMHVANYLQGSARNTGFEAPYTLVGVNNGISGMAAVDWYDNSSWANPTVTYSQDTDNPHGGASAQKIDVISPGSVSGAAVQFAQQVAVIPEQTYTFTAWVRGTPGMEIHQIIRQQPQPYANYASRTVRLTADWQQISVSGVVHDNGDVLLMFHTNSSGTFWVDDVSFTDESGKPVSGGVPWPQAPIGTLRLWDSGTAWTSLEPVKGVWNWEPLDAWVNAAESHGVKQILLTLGQSPAWASSQPDNVNYVGAGAPAPPRDIQDWRDYITAVGERYKGRISSYEIWNEPNDPTYYAGTVAQLVDLTREAYQILKAIDPAITVVAPVPYAAGYLDQLLQAGMAPYVDVISFHFYTYTAPPEQVGSGIANVRLVMAKNGVSDVPFWDTEGASGDTTTSEDQGAAYLVRRYLVDLAFGSARYNWYTWSKGSTFCAATEKSDPRQLTKAGMAFRVVQNWLHDASLTGVNIDSNGTWQMGLTLADGSAGMIVWNPSATVPFAIPENIAASTSRDIFGGSTAIAGSTITVNAYPVLLSGYSQPAPAVNSVVNAADGKAGLAPGGLAVVTGSGFATDATPGGFAPLPAVLDGVSVFVNGVISPLLYADSGQVVFQMPSTTLTGGAEVRVGSPSGMSASATVTVSAAAPAVFRFAGRAMAVNEDGRLNMPGYPALPGSTLLVYLTGIGPATPAPNDGSASTDTPSIATLSATATIGGFNAPVQLLSLAPGLVGVAQALLQVPNLPLGDYSVIITVNGAASSPALVSVGPTPAQLP
jgi:uncharacterized protein (TIGR03437 family)